MDVGIADDVRPGIALELPGEAEQFQAVLGRQESPRDRDGVQARRKEHDREQTPAMGHRDPP